MSMQSVGTTETRPMAFCSRRLSSRASSASRAPARVQHPPTQNWTLSFPLGRDARRQSLQSCAIAGPPQTVSRVRLGAPHIGQTALVRGSPYMGSRSRTFMTPSLPSFAYNPSIADLGRPFGAAFPAASP